MTLELLPFELTIVRLAPSEPFPVWTAKSRLLSLFRGNEELSIIAESESVPRGLTTEGGWCALKLVGTQPFTLTGVLESILGPLAEAEVSILALSTYDTDYVLVKVSALEEAVAALADRFCLRYAVSGLPLRRSLETGRLRLRKFRESDLKGSEYTYAVVEKATDSVIGSCGLTRFDNELTGAELSYVLHREFWGRGYATELAQELLRYGFRELGLQRIHAYCFKGNGASRRVLEKLGMRHLGEDGVQTSRHDHPVPSDHFEILQEEYRFAVARATTRPPY